MVWRAERQMARYHEDNLKLAASYARADAASRAKSLFLANMSHELRTPLNAIIGFAEVIKSSTLDTMGRADYREFAGDIVMSGRHLLRVINDVLDLAKIETGNMSVSYTVVDAGEIARGVVKLLAQEAAAAHVALRVEGACAPFDCDETKLRQLLLNLTANAVKFTPAGGRVTLGLREVGAGRDVEVVVRDTGVGIKPEDLPAALAPFGQVDSSPARRHGGTGLGLPLSKKFAELLGGSLRIDSTPGTGTSVTVILPRRSQTAGFASAA
jgi:two-component system cell cycle sensor histidine kinase PleC